MIINADIIRKLEFGSKFCDTISKLIQKNKNQSKKKRKLPSKKEGDEEEEETEEVKDIKAKDAGGDLEKKADVDNAILYLFLLSERFKPELRRQQSFWKPYIDLLPKTFSTSLFFTDQELGLLEGTNLHSSQ